MEHSRTQALEKRVGPNHWRKELDQNFGLESWTKTLDERVGPKRQMKELDQIVRADGELGRGAEASLGSL